MSAPAIPTRTGRIARAGWAGIGLVCVGLGGVGIVVPGLPTTVFFIAAAWCFSRSSARLERWVLDLPRIGPMVRDYRAGLGMPRRAKVGATVMLVVFVGLSVWLAIGTWLVAAGIALAGAAGIVVIWWRVPTREDVLETA